SRRRHTRSDRDWSSDVCSSDLPAGTIQGFKGENVTVAASATQNLVNYTSGDGYVSDLMIAIGSADASARDASLLNITYNNEGSRSEEHTSELQSRSDLVCRLLL